MFRHARLTSACALALVLLPALSGCVGSIVAGVVTAPIKAAGKAIDVIAVNAPAKQGVQQKQDPSPKSQRL